MIAEREQVLIEVGSVVDVFDAPNGAELLEAYADESSIPGLPRPNPQRAVYEGIERSGIMDVFLARIDGRLVGFVGVLTWVVPHYGVLLSTLESYYVERVSRRSGAGLMLLRMAEQASQRRKAQGLLVSAPVAGVLSEVLPRAGYWHSNTVFFKSFAAGPGA